MSGLVNFQLSLVVQSDSTKGYPIWETRLDYAETPEIKDFKCGLPLQYCDEAKHILQTRVPELLFFFKQGKDGQEAYAFDLPFAHTQLKGILDFIMISQSRPENMIHVEANDEFVSLFMNCKTQNIESSLSEKLLASDYFEVRAYNNLLDAFTPDYDLQLELEELIPKLESEYPDVGKQASEVIQKLNLNLAGTLSITNNPVTLKDVAYKPGLKNQTNARVAQKSPHIPMDQLSATQTLFLQLTDSKSDLNLIPVQLKFDILAKIRKSFMLDGGWSQEVKLEDYLVDISLDKCITVPKEQSLSSSKEANPDEKQNKDDDDEEYDEDEDDDDEDEVTVRKGPSYYLCQLLPGIFQMQKPKLMDMINKALLPSYSNVLDLAQDNAWVPIKEQTDRFAMLCTGLHSKEPLSYVHGDHFKVVMQLKKDLWQPGVYCDSSLFQTEFDPAVKFGRLTD